MRKVSAKSEVSTRRIGVVVAVCLCHALAIWVLFNDRIISTCICIEGECCQFPRSARGSGKVWLIAEPVKIASDGKRLLVVHPIRGWRRPESNR